MNKQSTLQINLCLDCGDKYKNCGSESSPLLQPLAAQTRIFSLVSIAGSYRVKHSFITCSGGFGPALHKGCLCSSDLVPAGGALCCRVPMKSRVML